MKLRYLVLFTLFSMPMWADTHTASGCDPTAAIAAASNGDVVTVGTGGSCSASWNINLMKAITLGCQAGSTCTISGSITLNSNASTPVRLTGFTFTSSGALTTTRATTDAAMRVDHNTFTGGGTMVTTYGFGPMLFDHNSLTGTTANEMMHVMGTGAGDYSVWTNDVIPGSPNMLYLEDNTFTGSGGYVNAEQGYYGIQVVIRHNNMNNAQTEMHGNTYYKSRWWEIYSNTFINSTQGMSGTIRGGSGVFFNNTCSGSNCSIGFREDNVSTYSACNQVGRGISNTVSGSPCANGASTEKASPVYIWGNSPQSACIDPGNGWNNCTIGMVQVNRDLFASSSQPASLTRCESAADRTAGCPVTYAYTPFTYPYPLTANGMPNPSGSGGGPVATPTDSPGQGTYSSTQTVTLSDATSGATICYTTNGSTPSATTAGTCDAGSTTYSSGFSVSATTTVKAIGTMSGMTNSGALTSVYTISAGGSNLACANVTTAYLGSVANGSSYTVTTPCTINNDVTISKGITLNGNGATMNKGFFVTPNATASTRITGFTFDPRHGWIQVGNPYAIVQPGVKPFRIDHNTWGTVGLNGPSGVNVEVYALPGVAGLIDNNTMYAGQSNNGMGDPNPANSGYGPEVIHVFGGINHCAPGNCGDTWQDQIGWHSPVTPGGSGMIYVEHNTINDVMNSVNGCSWIQNYVGSASVSRYNTVTNCAFDVHGTATMVGARWWEIYENTYYIPSGGFNYSDIRAGSGLIYHNHLAGGSQVKSWQIREEDSSSYPACYQIGRGYDPTTQGNSVNPGWQSCTKDYSATTNLEQFSPVYFWGNDASMENNFYIPSGSIVLGRDIMCWDGSAWSGTCGNTSDPPLPVQIHRCQAGTEAGCAAGTTSTGTYAYTAFTYPYPLDANGMPNPSGGGGTMATVTTTAASNITDTTATTGGNVTSDGGASVTARGVCYSAAANPTTPCVPDSPQVGGQGSFTSYLTSLSPGVQYHIRAYATNSAGTSYGSDLNFTATTTPVAGLSVSSISFGSQMVATTSAVQYVTVTNTGLGTLTVSSYSVTGDFARSGGTCSTPANLIAGQNCTYGLTFTPTQTGARSGNLSLTDNAAGSPHTVALSGAGSAPAVTLDATSYNFGNQMIGQQSTGFVVNLTNSGSAPLTISSITPSGDFADTSNCPLSPTKLPSGDSCTITATFTPTTTGARSGSVSIADNAAGTPHSISLTGTGAAAVSGSIGTGISAGTVILR